MDQLFLWIMIAIASLIASVYFYCTYKHRQHG